jgi:low temperature requirement protein LtrA
MNYTWFSSAFDNDDVATRALVLVIMAGALIFAGGIAYIFRTLDFSFGIVGWIIMRIGMVSLWLRVARAEPKLRTTALRYAGGISLAQLLWIVLALAITPGSTAFYIIGCSLFVLEWSVPPYAERAGATPWHRDHMIERYGLLTIIVLGEVLLSIAITFGALFEGRVDGGLIVIAISALVTVFAFWWIYFAEAQHLATKYGHHTFIWGYGHLFIFASLALMGAGLAAYFDLQTGHSKANQQMVAWFVGAPLATAMLALWVVRDQFLKLGLRAFALPVGAAAILIATALNAQAPVFAALTLAILLARVPFSPAKGLHP